jgi:hypothetical protein
MPTLKRRKKTRRSQLKRRLPPNLLNLNQSHKKSEKLLLPNEAPNVDKRRILLFLLKRRNKALRKVTSHQNFLYE